MSTGDERLRALSDGHMSDVLKILRMPAVGSTPGVSTTAFEAGDTALWLRWTPLLSFEDHTNAEAAKAGANALGLPSAGAVAQL